MTEDNVQPGSERPRFRNDLVAQPIEEEGVRYVDVTDPSSGSTFRFYDVEYSIACAMDGARDLDNLAEWTRAELGIEASTDELESVVNTLAELGYLESNGAAASSADQEAVPTEISSEPTDLEGDSYTDEAAGPSVEIEAPPPLVARPVDAGPIEDIELGPPGRVADDAEETTPVEVEDHDVHVESAAATAGPASEAETSFAGLLDEEGGSPPEPAEPVLAARSPARGVSHFGDEEDPTMVPPATPMSEDEDDDDVSVDLSAHLALDKREVEEAVRSSRVHAIPPEISLEVDDDREALAAIREAAAASSAPHAEPPAARSAPPPIPQAAIEEAPEEKVEPARPEARPVTRPPEDVRVPPAVPLPARPPAQVQGGATVARARPSRPIEPTRVPPPAKAPQRSSSVGLLLVLLLALAAFAAAYMFRDRIFGTDDYAGREAPAATPPAAKRPTPPAPTPVAEPTPAAAMPVAVVRADEAGAQKLVAMAPAAGNIAWSVEDGATVEADAVVAKLGGFARHEARLNEGVDRGKYYGEKLAEAQAKGDTASAEVAQRKVDEKKLIADEATKELERFYIKAPAAGAAKLLVAKGAAVKAGDAIVEIGAADGAAAGPTLRATFDAGAASSSYQDGAACVVAAKDAQDRRFACVVEKVADGKVDVRLVAVSGSATAVPGDEVVLLPADSK